MLKNKLITVDFKKHVKSGLYIDYLGRLIVKSALLNIFIWGGLYISEKYIIEYICRFSFMSSKYNKFSFFKSHQIVQSVIKWCLIVMLLLLI